MNKNMTISFSSFQFFDDLKIFVFSGCFWEVKIYSTIPTIELKLCETFWDNFGICNPEQKGLHTVVPVGVVGAFDDLDLVKIYSTIPTSQIEMCETFWDTGIKEFGDFEGENSFHKLQITIPTLEMEIVEFASVLHLWPEKTQIATLL